MSFHARACTDAVRVSTPSRSSSAVSRHAYTLHVTDGATEYSPQNWIQRDAAFPVRGFL